ncbi:hypothetical protein K9M48_01125 [Candidatus Gracilibacteria bacterium]|nr:hypothetical protein [Candidatus Gracilibacteria bacterium]
MNEKISQSHIDYLLSEDGKKFLILKVSKEKRLELITVLKEINKNNVSIKNKQRNIYTKPEGNWTERLNSGSDNPFTGGAGFGGND